MSTRTTSVTLWIGITILMVSLINHADAAADPSAAELTLNNWINAQRSGAHARLRRDDARALEELLGETLVAAPADLAAAAAGWATQDFALAAVGADLDLLGLRDVRRRLRGWGTLLLNRGTSRPVLVQAPHSDSDLLTGAIALRWLLAGSVAAVMVNTAPRAPRLSIAPPSDLGRLSPSLFTMSALAFSQHRNAAIVVQLHGMREDGSSAAAAANIDAIVSAGVADSRPHSRRATACLKRLGLSAREFGTEVTELGGTRNAVGVALREGGFDNFLHLELGMRLRQRLMHDSRLSAAVSQCL
jgi:hypothetical protein